MRKAALVAAALALSTVSAGASPAAPTATRADVTRACNSSVYGGIGSSWPERSIVVGAIGFVGARSYASADSAFSEIGGGRYRGNKVLVVVRAGWRVRVVVSDDERAGVALLYDRRTFNNPVVPALGDHAVTFVACLLGRPSVGPKNARWTQFNGAIAVDGRRCVTLEVYAAKRGHA